MKSLDSVMSELGMYTSFITLLFRGPEQQTYQRGVNYYRL